MQNQQIVIFVGPDRCGKTQIAKELSRIIFVPYFKAATERATFIKEHVSGHAVISPDVGVNMLPSIIADERMLLAAQKNVNENRFLNQLRYADPRVFDLLKQTGYSVIFDRGYPCEYAYSQILHRKTDLNLLYEMDEQWASIDTKIVFCHRSSYVGITDDIDPKINETVLQNLHEAYEDFFKDTKCKVLNLNVDDENLEREVNEVMKFIGYDDRAVFFMRKQAFDLEQQKLHITCNNGWV